MFLWCLSSILLVTAGLFSEFLFLGAVRLMIFSERQLCEEVVWDLHSLKTFLWCVLLARFCNSGEFHALQTEKKQASYTLLVQLCFITY